MALTHLIDTSVVSRLRHVEIRRRLHPATKAGRIGRTHLADLEVGFSARNRDEWDGLTKALTLFRLVQIRDHDLAEALDVQRRLAGRGQRGRKLPDLIIASVAHRLGLTLIQYDADFDLIASETGQVCEWVVPRGSID